MRPAAAPALIAAMFLAQPARAHAILVESSPAPYAHVAAGLLAIMFRYNSRIDAARSKLTLRRADHTAQRLALDNAEKPDLLKASIDLTPGEYTVAWQVLATDGHITRGTVPFTVDQK